ncbi:hypothetical protein HGRIS_012909 [Hohenbuehelia grisea]|uniref:Cyclohexanone monooxygenase n=1 Tax=Hohenbuehelia grisea TaxID=104357 RepID=A0ABR3ITS0_9AGAR
MAAPAPDNAALNELDVLIVGAGFSGLYQLHRFRENGYKAQVFEAGGDIGGTWYWNCYPGARVDSDAAIYQYNMPDLWKDFSFTECFPGGQEVLAYLHHCDKKFDLRRDIRFNTSVVRAHFDASKYRWAVTTDNGETVFPRFLSLCLGFSARPYTPTFPGADAFEGLCVHTSRWPQEGVDLTGKRVGVLGTGATGVQVIQELGPSVEHLTVFQRTPNLALPMRQHAVDASYPEQFPALLDKRGTTFAGFHIELANVDGPFDKCTPESRRALNEALWEKGAFHFWLGMYSEVFINLDLNTETYGFWREKVRERLKAAGAAERVADLLAPEKPPHPFGTKRPSLEQRYWETFGLPNVELVDVNAFPIEKMTPKGVLTADGKEHELDALVLATGFDAITGGIKQIDLRGTDTKLLRDIWDEHGLSTYLGMTVPKFPNMFFVYGPQGPTAFCNGPTCIEYQSDWIISLLNHAKTNGYTRIEATVNAGRSYGDLAHKCWDAGLWKKAKSWYFGANIPGKRVEPLNFAGGLPLYRQLCSEEAKNGYPGFELTSPTSSVKL